MNKLLSAYRWLRESTLRTSAGMAVLSLLFIAGLGLTHATTYTSYDPSNEVQMFLDVPLSQTQTTGIVISSPQINGSNFVFSTTTGGVLRIRSGNFREDIRYASGSVAATTNKVTLYGVIRNLCPQVARSYVSCGNGRTWGRGAIVELTQDARLFNLKANIDRGNQFSAVNGIRFTGSGSFGQPTFATTALRDQELGATPASGSGLVACVTATGLCYDGLGGAWVARGANATANASESVAGKVQIISAANLGGRTQTGSTNALNVLTPRWLIKNGTGATSANYIPQLNQNGVIGISLGGTGLASLSQSGVFIGMGTNTPQLITTSTSGSYLRTNSHGSWFAASPNEDIIQNANPYEKIIVASGDTNFTNTLLIPASLATGSVLTVQTTGTGGSSGAWFKQGLKVGSTEICSGNQDNTAGAAREPWALTATLIIRRNGAVGELLTNCTINGISSTTNTGSKITINTTTTNTLNIFDRSNGSTGYLYLNSLLMKKRNP